MDNKNTNNQEIEIDLSRLFQALFKRAWLIAAVAVLCAVVTLVFTLLFVAPKYQSSAMFYVNNSSLSLEDLDFTITSSDISASKSLVKSYIVILQTRETLTAVIDYAGVDMTYGQLLGMIHAEAVDNTEIFRIVVTSTDPAEAELLADAIAHILPKRIATIIEGTSTKVVDSAVLPLGASAPDYTRNTILGFVLGFLAMVVFVGVRQLLDVTIREEENITQSCKYPVLSAVPNMHAAGKGDAYFGYGRKKQSGKTPEAGENGKQRSLFGSEIGFAASEAYKLLRTKLQFSFADAEGSRVIGVTSTLAGEGKSVTAVNLAYSLSELGKRVVLIDADMRRPTLAEKLKIRKKPGLSSFLTGQSNLEDLVQYCGIEGDEHAFHVITAGQNPPNPVELLSSRRMDKALDILREHYDYIIVDLPPVKEVSDVLAVADKLDGLLMVVRQNYCNRVEMATAIRQLEFVNANLLGIVFNSVVDDHPGYGNHYYNRSYRHYYRRQYGRYYNEQKRQTEAGVQQQETK